MRYFDYHSVVREPRFPSKKLRKLVDLIGKDFPNDPMPAELRMLRACLAIRDGHIQIDDAPQQVVDWTFAERARR